MADRPQPSVGLLGLGNMGLVVAGRLLAAGPVVAYDPDAERCRLAGELGVEVAASTAEVGRRASTVVLSLPAPAISWDAVQVLHTFWAGEGEQGTILETSTLTPDDVHRCPSLRSVALVAPAGEKNLRFAPLPGSGQCGPGQVSDQKQCAL